jgi:ribonucleoside-diphosphate reductase alpha chain
MLDNVLDAAHWPLEQQHAEAANKRRVGLGFTGLGDALAMLACATTPTKPAPWPAASANSCAIAYLASVDLAKERGAFPLFNADLYLSGGTFAAPAAEVKDKIRKHGLRNSHLLSIAPTGTISLAFADNASNGIEPPFSWTYTRKKRMADGTFKEYAVEDYAWRLYRTWAAMRQAARLLRHRAGNLRQGPQGHGRGRGPCIDTSISKTVNVPADYPYADFQDLYPRPGSPASRAWPPTGPTACSVRCCRSRPAEQKQPQDAEMSDDTNRRLSIKSLPARCCRPCAGPAARTCRTATRLDLHGQHPHGNFALFVGHNPVEDTGWRRLPLRGGERRRAAARPGRRGQDPVDGHARQRPRLAQAQARRPGHRGRGAPSRCASAARRAEADARRGLRLRPGHALALRAARRPRRRRPDPGEGRPVQPQEPKTGTDGTLSWTVDVSNPATGEDFVLGLKEITLPDGTSRPYSMWLSGNYPRALDGLSKLLSLDMRVWTRPGSA